MRCEGRQVTGGGRCGSCSGDGEEVQAPGVEGLAVGEATRVTLREEEGEEGVRNTMCKMSFERYVSNLMDLYYSFPPI